VIADTLHVGAILTVLAKAGEKPSVVIEVIAFVIFIGIVIGVLVGIAYTIGWIWRNVSGNKEQQTGASAHTPRTFNCHPPRATQTNQTYECPQGHIWISYQHQRRVPGRKVYDPNSPGPPPQKRLIQEPDTFVNDGLKWRYEGQREPDAQSL
jgi:hypothetical protein